LGAVTTTFIAGVDAVRHRRRVPVGSLTQLGHLQTENGEDLGRIADALDLARPHDLVFGVWDPYRDNGYQAARRAGVLSSEDLEAARPTLEEIEPMPAVFDPAWVSRLEGTDNVKTRANLMDLAEQVMEDIERFSAINSCSRLVMIWCASTEAFSELGPVHQSLDAFERGLKESDPSIAPSQIYAYAALRVGVPFANGAPNLTVEIPALRRLAERNGVPFAGKDFKTGQTMIKTAIAPALRARVLGLNGWYSTNILGNRDGEVLDDPANFRTKEVSKLGVLEDILLPDRHPELYGDIHHQVRINYYPPRGDDKEGWDNIDLFGWMGYPMQIKIDFLCKDSILAAPIVLDLALLLDLAARRGETGVQDWLGFFFKSPHSASGRPESDLFAQERRLHRRLASLAKPDSRSSGQTPPPMRAF
jgi:myo-inositol-1-phosphate synthase